MERYRNLPYVGVLRKELLKRMAADDSVMLSQAKHL
jgi:hypothetical protein